MSANISRRTFLTALSCATSMRVSVVTALMLSSPDISLPSLRLRKLLELLAQTVHCRDDLLPLFRIGPGFFDSRQGPSFLQPVQQIDAVFQIGEVVAFSRNSLLDVLRIEVLQVFEDVVDNKFCCFFAGVSFEMN